MKTLMNQIKAFVNDEEGVSAVEYGLLIAGIAAVVMVAIYAIGTAIIRERFKLTNQVTALTAEGRLSGLVLVMLPPATGLALYFINPDYISQLWLTPSGQTMSMIALAFQVLGILTIRKIVKIKV